ncbi:prefoldin, alpha subunit [Verruconis gallopava]|uniref:Prefoldin, alpha subunit n=1 Tax=Verruconis gallopava TaxID=253628 RepID=A0A0D2AJ12_9PEZI|nr:prefoldin, alpha subunit [Verruconis gallopava]KIV98918.1 prefoldin, alpha subunit [Verruconis gallopava]
MASTGGGSTVKLNDLPLQDLSNLKKQIDEELQTLSSSFQSLRAAQSKFRDCLTSLAKGLESKNTSRNILVPLTSSLYVPGKLKGTETVIVDVGTGFFVEKKVDEAKVFYEGKIKELQTNLSELDKILANKAETARAVEGVLRQKIMESQKQGGGAAATSASS